MNSLDGDRDLVPDQLVRLAVAEITPYAIILVDTHGRVLSWNRGAESLFGYHLNDVLGSPITRFFTPEDARDGRPERELRLAEANGHSQDDNWLVRKDGSRFWAEGVTSAVRNQTGQIEAFVKVITDLTERHRDQVERANLLAREETARARAESAEGRLNVVLDSIGDAICALDVAYRLTYANDRFRQLIQALPHHPSGEILGQTIWDLVPQLENTNFRAEFQHIVEQRAPKRFEEFFRPWNVWFEVHAHPVNAGMILYLRDITRRKLVQEKLEAESERLRAVIAYSPVGIVLVHATDGHHVVANHKAEELFGHPLPADQGIVQFVGQIALPSGVARPYDDLAIVRALRGETVVAEEEVLRRPGGEARVLVSAVPLHEHGGVAGAVVVYEDITRIRELERLREEWASVVAHDLRQPIAVILGYADLLRRHVHQNLTAQVEQSLEHVIASSRHLEKMVGDLLEVSRIETRRLTLQRQLIDVLDFVTEVVNRLAPVTGDHPIRLEVRGGIPRTCADPARIEQVLSNLLSNAAKYSYPQTEILVAVERRNDAIRVAVTNLGIGVPTDEVGEIFSRFYRTEAARVGKVGGLGLGLYISKGIVEAHGGTIGVESIPSKATTFFFTLPIVASCPEG